MKERKKEKKQHNLVTYICDLDHIQTDYCRAATNRSGNWLNVSQFDFRTTSVCGQGAAYTIRNTLRSSEQNHFYFYFIKKGRLLVDPSKMSRHLIRMPLAWLPLEVFWARCNREETLNHAGGITYYPSGLESLRGCPGDWGSSWDEGLT